MSRQTESPFRQMMSVLDTARAIVLNTLFVLFMALVLLGILALGGFFGDRDELEILPGTALRLAPEGVLVEEYSGVPLQRAFDQAIGDGMPQVRHRDLIEAIETAASDKRIAVLVLELDRLIGGGPAMYQDLAEVVERFRAAGKRVIAMGDFYDQGPYYVAAQADEVLMHPMGLAFLTGYGVYQNYYKEALDYLQVEWNVFHAGEYKSYGEPFTRTGMSEEAREANAAFLDDLWRIYQGGVETARGLEEGSVDNYIRSLGGERTGDFARAAMEAGLVDALLSRDEMYDHVAAFVGGDQAEELGFNHVDYRPYLQQVRIRKGMRAGQRDKVAVLVAEGTIIEGDQPPGVIASERLVRDIRRLRDDHRVRAVVLRVNSGGGSAFASEVIKRELMMLQRTGKPLIVSMGSVAASGGYWVSMTADEIWAQPTSITGSIGVVAMFPTFEHTLNKFGVRSDGVGTTPLAGAFRLDRTLPSEAKHAIQASVDHLYQVFIGSVAEHRGMPVAAVDDVGRGRVWSGTAALEYGLVDSLGGLRQAIESAARRAGLEQYAVQYVEPELTFFDRLLIDMFQPAMRLFEARSESSVMKLPLVRQIAQELKRLEHFNDPRGVYAFCFCELP